MKSYVYILLALMVLALTACSGVETTDDSSDPVDIIVGDNSNADKEASLDVVTLAVCEEELGHVVYTAGSYECEAGETVVGLVEDYESPAICCRADV